MLRPPHPKKVIGRFWGAKTKSGEGYMTGVIDMGVGGELDVVVFKNKFRDAEKNQPEYHMKAAFKKGEEPSSTQEDEDPF